MAVARNEAKRTAVHGKVSPEMADMKATVRNVTAMRQGIEAF